MSTQQINNRVIAMRADAVETASGEYRFISVAVGHRLAYLKTGRDRESYEEGTDRYKFLLAWCLGSSGERERHIPLNTPTEPKRRKLTRWEVIGESMTRNGV